ncbi:unnamed protein product [Tuber melanosporum]|jgi:hypothetical protein|uniref:(Perigord truffle) hypothetical protein n=1 Tax=Tuber melanosporum (strain Mel28) TaxID=656061 RepID=D5GBX1_TUBMM|nr:uncharacterized protein GSTUM_00005625001 [Tuber melanosporum]CAZ81971.1 unnamed protein product [Tuber melanosporum]
MIPFQGEHRWTFQSPWGLTFRQEQLPNSPLTVKGNVRIKPYTPRGGRNGDVIIDLDMKMSHRDVQSMIEIQAVTDGVVIRTKPQGSWSTLSCLTIAATISIPLTNPHIRGAGVYTETLGITVEPSCDLVTELLELKTVAGDITLNNSFGVEASELKISTISGSINGHFGLLKSIELYAASGAIKSSVFPLEHKHTDDIASYRATTISGHIDTSFSDTNLPRRTYETEVNTTAGRIRGQYLLGHALSLRTTSGSISSTIIPTGARNAQLSTVSSQGSTELRFKRGLGAGRLGLFAKHEAICGNVNVKYPADFEGVLTASTVAGRIAIGGEGVNTVASGWPITRRVDGTKGVGRVGRGGTIEAVGTSGGIQLWVG